MLPPNAEAFDFHRRRFDSRFAAAGCSPLAVACSTKRCHDHVRTTYLSLLPVASSCQIPIWSSSIQKVSECIVKFIIAFDKVDPCPLLLDRCCALCGEAGTINNISSKVWCSQRRGVQIWVLRGGRRDQVTHVDEGLCAGGRTR